MEYPDVKKCFNVNGLKFIITETVRYRRSSVYRCTFGRFWRIYQSAHSAHKDVLLYFLDDCETNGYINSETANYSERAIFDVN